MKRVKEKRKGKETERGREGEKEEEFASLLSVL